ncbi:nucleoside-diphosphate kinase [Candidatus Pacearchaeota archaeon]|nr:nucleoside-diphosphate kinase [Candidatus Pacearchaeota archaeon]
MATQTCLVLIKPDGLIKSLTGNIISILSETKLKIIGSKMVSVQRELAEKHYHQLKEQKPEIYEEVLKYIMGEYHTKRVLALVYQGEDAINKIRVLAGSTNPEKADPVSIRGKYGRINSTTKVLENVMHASDSEESAKREIQLWFQPGELTESVYPTKKTKVSEERTVWS